MENFSLNQLALANKCSIHKNMNPFSEITQTHPPTHPHTDQIGFF